MNLAPSDPPFFGEPRRLLVEGLVSAFDLVNAGSGPMWVSLEAPPGWGKTRIVKEFYRALAADRQSSPKYWPSSINGSHEGTPVYDLNRSRKLIYPNLRQHTPGSLPSFVWWGINASPETGISSYALGKDLLQLDAHSKYIDDAWRKIATFPERTFPQLREIGILVSQEAVVEVAGKVAESMLGASIPGFGLIATLMETIRVQQRERHDRLARLDSQEDISSSGADLARQAFAVISRIARPGLPMVIFVEDAHFATKPVIDLLNNLIRSNSATLLITTGWQGHLEGNHELHRVLSSESAGRIVRITPTSNQQIRPFPSGAGLGALSPEDRSKILLSHYPQVDINTRNQLIERYENPLALELIVSLPRYRARFPTGDLKLSPAEISTLPLTIRDLYRDLWRSLPEREQHAVTLASFGVPAAIAPKTSASLLWNSSILLDALRPADAPESPSGTAPLVPTGSGLSWTYPAEGVLWQFYDRNQITIAFEDDGHFSLCDREQFLRRLADVLKSLSASSPRTRVESEHAYELARALSDKGFLSTDEVRRIAKTLFGRKQGWGPPRKLFTIQAPSRYTTFNSITNNPRQGFEPAYFRVKEVDDSDDNLMFHAALVPGARYLGYIYFHNNAVRSGEITPDINIDPARDAIDTTIRVLLPAVVRKGVVVDAVAEIVSKSAIPQKVWSTISLTSETQDVALGYILDSAELHTRGRADGSKLPNLLGEGGALIGFDYLDGTIYASDARTSGYVTFQFSVEAPNFSVSLKVRLKGEKEWHDSVSANVGSVVQFQIEYRNTGTVFQEHVVAQVRLPESLGFRYGATRLKNVNYPDSKSLADGIEGSGYNLGGYTPGSNCFVLFEAQFRGPRQKSESILTARVFLITRNGTKQSAANVVLPA